MLRFKRENDKYEMELSRKMESRLSALQEKYPVAPKRRILRPSKSKNEFFRKSEMARKMKDLQCFESQPYRDFIQKADVKVAKTS